MQPIVSLCNPMERSNTEAGGFGFIDSGQFRLMLTKWGWQESMADLHQDRRTNILC